MTLPEPDIERVSEPIPPAMLSFALNCEAVKLIKSLPLPASTERFVDWEEVVIISSPSPEYSLKDLLNPSKSRTSSPSYEKNFFNPLLLDLKVEPIVMVLSYRQA